jgi:hypothetical protein
LLQEVGYAVLVGLAVSGKPVESLEEDLRVQRRPEFDQDAGLLVGVVPKPVRCARRSSSMSYRALPSHPERRERMPRPDFSGLFRYLEKKNVRIAS